MKMLNNVLEGGAFAISRIPIQSPRFMKMGKAVLPCAAPPPEHPAQVHRHHAEDVAVAVAEHVDGVDDREQKKRYKHSVLPSTVQVPCVAHVEALWPLGTNANAPRPDVDHPPNDNGI